MTLYDEIVKETKGFEKILGVAVKHLGTGEEASFNGDELFPTASVFKVPVIVELYRQVEAGRLSLDDRLVLKDSLKVPGSGILKELSEGLEVTVTRPEQADDDPERQHRHGHDRGEGREGERQRDDAAASG